ncbi:response regulator transcription factor [Rhizobium skierniewicense]|uniref:response regulator transcription factor n=1 Tax=Rhizobium TaxID=379 RepID=UPI0017828CBB|nr:MULTISPECIES: response regulator transcription factor [Rhizobium]MBD8688791.1 response regulator transcription factor [Rhizobium sp. CFBP 13644]MBD8694363.1 response regulator transcription factor [Rhizobium sp. CFBP 13717]MCI9868728.1 response regulator transcription factor [Rhizobium skierniewicense]
MSELLIVEDDVTLAKTLKRSFERKGYRVRHAACLAEMSQLLDFALPDFAIVDLKLSSESGLACVEELVRRQPHVRAVVLTGFASIATAIEAIKLGACHYLPKPSPMDEIERAFHKTKGEVDVPISERQLSLKGLEWEKIHQTLIATEFNISEAARRLGLHRRTLARKLDKRHTP